MNKKWVVATLFGISVTSANLQAEQFTVEIENLTNGIYFTPLLVAAHDSSTHLFETGSAASTSLETMAEGGDISGLVTDIASASPVTVENPKGGLLAPGESTTTVMLNTDDSDNGYLSIVAMMLPTNDGFVGLDSWEIPSTAGTYTFTINGYDAGTEGNDELTGSIPAPIDFGTGTGGTGVSTNDNNATVHIHPGSIGDDDSAGGISDLDNSVHRWLNPIARITVVIQ
ncbi:MAG: spondin domain-containing protein [Pseudomonadales bacterium]|nr:spondin domain-containing protein [Pseudomonadales bacterium]